MNILRIRAHAKINLYLDVLNRREDGYHEIQTVMQSIGVYDELKINHLPSGISLRCKHPQLSNPQSNLALRAAQLLGDRTGSKNGAEIKLKKNIPIGAGLAGGSADAAGVLVGLNIMWGLDLTLRELQELGAELGSDIPFCLEGGTLLAEGRGEVLQKVSDFPDANIILAKPSFSLSAAEIYKQWDEGQKREHPDIHAFLNSLESCSLKAASANLANALEQVVFKTYPEVQTIKERCLEAGALGALMSGSGPSVFAVAQTSEQASRIHQMLQGLCPCLITASSPVGIEIV